MASTSETGHAMNVANFEDLINFCVGYGPAYNPTKAAIKADALTTQLTNAQATLQAVKVAKTAYDNATNQREIAFAPLKKLSTRIVNALAATDAASQTLDDAKTSNKKIQGTRVAKKPGVGELVAEGEVKATSSSSQQSFDRKIDNFSQLIETVVAEPTYIPNEEELKVASLNTVVQNLKTKNSAVIATATALSNARIARDKALYAEPTGLYDTALAVKTYIKSVFGPGSPQYKQVSKLKFT